MAQTKESPQQGTRISSTFSEVDKAGKTKHNGKFTRIERKINK